MKKLSKASWLIIIGIILFISYFWASGKILEKIYPWAGDNIFDANIDFYSPNESCIELEPSYMIYDNQRGYFQIYVFMFKRCDFDYIKIDLSGTNIDKYNTISPDLDLINETWNQSIPNKNTLIIKSDDLTEFQDLQLTINMYLNEKFFNYYQISARNKIEQFRFKFDNSLLGYIAEESDFQLIKGESTYEEKIFLGKSKKYRFDPSIQSLILRFNPKSSFLVLIQKFLDYIILGIIAVIIYEVVKSIFLKKENKTKTIRFIMIKKITKNNWLREYHKDFFIAVFGGLAFAIAYQGKGLAFLTDWNAFLAWFVYLIMFIIVYILGAIALYPFR